MGKQPTDEIRAGLESITSLPGIVVLSRPEWSKAKQRWVIHCRITADVVAGGLIPPATDWFVLVGEAYPYGSIGIYPAKEGGITQTFPHQNYNGEGDDGQPWRSGKLCTWTDAAPLRRRGYDVEPAEPEQNLAWHLTRAQEWLKLASANELTQIGDYYELPYVPNRNGMSVAFCEGSSTLRQWQASGKRHGIARGKLLDTDPAILAVTRFDTGQGRPAIEQEWGRGVSGEDGKESVWIRLDSVPVLPPYQVPMTWWELRRACGMQGIDLDKLLRPALSQIQGGSPVLLAGFPIPEKIGGPNCRMHWLVLLMPEKIYRPIPGFRNNEQGQWLAYRRTAIPGGAALHWLNSENWHREEISARGRLSAETAQRKLLIIGAGAIGSVLAEMLARAGAREVVIMDRDRLEAGNLVRHTMLASDIGQSKSSGVSDRLNDATIHTKATPVVAAFPPVDDDSASLVRTCDVVIDATGDDAVAAAMSRFAWREDKIFVSVSLGLHARRLFCFTAQGSSFPNEKFKDCLQPWLQLEREEYDPGELPRDGPGCWHPRHPARIDDVWMMSAAAVKLIEQAIDLPPKAPSLTVLEQHKDANGNFAGIRDVSQDSTPR